MKKIIASVVILVGLFVAWSAWPFIGLYDLARGAQAGDLRKIEERVDFPALRRSLSSQIITTHARLTGLRLDRYGLMVGVGAALADPFIEKLLTPVALAEFLKGGWPESVLADRPAGLQTLDWNALGSVWQLYSNSEYGLFSFRLKVPASQPHDKQFRIHLALADWNWKLAGLELPVDLQERLARELIKQQASLPERG